MLFEKGKEIMIFVSGVHGVGKSYFCNLVKESAGIETYSASTFDCGKKAVEIFERQAYSGYR